LLKKRGRKGHSQLRRECRNAKRVGPHTQFSKGSGEHKKGGIKSKKHNEKRGRELSGRGFKKPYRGRGQVARNALVWRKKTGQTGEKGARNDKKTDNYTMKRAQKEVTSPPSSRTKDVKQKTKGERTRAGKEKRQNPGRANSTEHPGTGP